MIFKVLKSVFIVMTMSTNHHCSCYHNHVSRVHVTVPAQWTVASGAAAAPATSHGGTAVVQRAQSENYTLTRMNALHYSLSC